MGGTSTVVVYDGNKFFWRRRVTIDVVIVEHKEFDTTEVITYEPSIDRESSRIYLASSILSTKISQEDIAAKMSFAKQHNVPHTIQFVTGVLNRAISDYILNRLFISDFSTELKVLSVVLQFNLRDRDSEFGGDNIDQLIREKPAGLCPHEVLHHKAVVAGEADAVITALEEEKRFLAENCHKAEELVEETRVPLTVKERWRIPIVLGKVAKNTILSEGDAKIWSAVASNLTTQEAIDNATKVTTRMIKPALKRMKAKAAVAASNRGAGLLSPLSRPPLSPRRSVGPGHCPTPTARHRSLDKTHSAPTTPLTRNDSMRYMNNTTMSLLRAQSLEEPVEKSSPKKLVRRVSKSCTTPKGGKSPKRRRFLTRSPSTSGDMGEHDAKNTSLVDNPISECGENEDSVGIIAKLAAGFASLTSTLRASVSSSKNLHKHRAKVHIVDPEQEGIVMMDGQCSFTGSFKSSSFHSGSFKNKDSYHERISTMSATTDSATDYSFEQHPRLSFLNSNEFENASSDLLRLNDAISSPRTKVPPRCSFRDAVSQFTADNSMDFSSCSRAHSYSNENEECVPAPTPAGSPVFFGARACSRFGSAVADATAAAEDQVGPLVVGGADPSIAQLFGLDPSEMAPPRKRHFFFSTLLGSFSDSSHCSEQGSAVVLLPAALQQGNEDACAKAACKDPCTCMGAGAFLATAPSSVKLSGAVSSKRRQSFLGETLSGWLKWGGSSKQATVSAKVAPVPLSTVQAQVQAQVQAETSLYYPPGIGADHGVRALEARLM